MPPQHDGDETRDNQALLNFSRGDRHSLRDDANFPDTRDDHGKLVSGGTLKLLLVAIDSFGDVCWATYDTIAERTRRWGKGISRRTVVSALQALVRLGALDRFEGLGPMRKKRIGHRIIWWPGVSTYCSDDLRREFGRRLFPTGPGGASQAPSKARAKSSALDAEWSALEAPPINAQECTADGVECTADGVECTADGVECTGVHSKLQEASYEATNEAPSDVCADEGEDGARFFFPEELAAVRANANALHAVAPAQTRTDRELLLKIATLWHDGQLSDDSVQQVLESYQRKAEAGDPVQKPLGWMWVSFRNQCHDRGWPRFEKLLANTAYPRELLDPPAAAGCRTSFQDGALVYAAAKSPSPRAHGG